MRPIDLIKGTIFFIFSLVVCYESIHLPLWSAKKPGPGLFPLFLGISLGFLSLVFIIVKGFRKNREAAFFWADRRNRKRILFACGILISYAIVLPFLGFLVSTFFLVFFLLGLSYPGKWIVMGISSFLISIAFYIIFQILLKIQLPYGILGI
jgi:putative tricarboxylic transport membrane protein